MIAALAAIEYLGRITDKLFEARMKRAAVRIKARSQYYRFSGVRKWHR
jgi:hypothetical protein